MRRLLAERGQDGVRRLRRVRRDGADRLTVPGCPECCGSTEYYYARRCDNPNVPNPDGSPGAIYIPAPFFCAPTEGGSCELAGLQIVLYHGVCYQVQDADPPQTQPCRGQQVPKAHRVRQEQLPNGAHIANPDEVVCKSLGIDCQNTDCVPIGPNPCCIERQVFGTCDGEPPLLCNYGQRFLVTFQYQGSATIRCFSEGTTCPLFVAMTETFTTYGQAVYACSGTSSVAELVGGAGTITRNAVSYLPAAGRSVSASESIVWPSFFSSDVITQFANGLDYIGSASQSEQTLYPGDGVTADLCGVGLTARLRATTTVSCRNDNGTVTRTGAYSDELRNFSSTSGFSCYGAGFSADGKINDLYCGEDFRQIASARGSLTISPVQRCDGSGFTTSLFTRPGIVPARPSPALLLPTHTSKVSGCRGCSGGLL